MSVRASAWCWEHAQVSGNELLVLLAIADHANDTGGGAWPSIKTLAAKARVSERTAQRVIGRLVAAQLVRVDVAAGPNGTNVYTVLMGSLSTPAYPPVTDDTPDDLTGVTPERHSPRVKAVSPHPRRQGDTRTSRTIKERQERPRSLRGAALPTNPHAAHCSRHRGSPANNCGPCRSEILGGAA
ncbi:helix-turn-helix domain-containing protein [Micromonospora coxensis]|uniref:helix-turn-helix domain-containing protein n=1 Tax=Micromonospora coxensis TaxID=356852 RepID=UPI003443ED6B